MAARIATKPRYSAILIRILLTRACGLLCSGSYRFKTVAAVPVEALALGIFCV